MFTLPALAGVAVIIAQNCLRRAFMVHGRAPASACIITTKLDCDHSLAAVDAGLSTPQGAFEPRAFTTVHGRVSSLWMLVDAPPSGDRSAFDSVHLELDAVAQVIFTTRARPPAERYQRLSAAMRSSSYRDRSAWVPVRALIVGRHGSRWCSQSSSRFRLVLVMMTAIGVGIAGDIRRHAGRWFSSV